MSVVVRPPPLGGPADEQQTLEGQGPQNGVEGITVTELIQRARNSTGEERAWLCTLVNRALAGLANVADKDREAELLLGMLEDEALHDLQDEQRVPCRAVAVEALLTMGYPWALQLHPDDVQFLRENPATPRLVVPLARVFSGLAGASAATFLGLSVLQTPSWWMTQLLGNPAELALVASMLLTVFSAIPMVLGAPWLKAARWMMGLASTVATAMILADAVGQRATVIHLVLMVIPVFGVLGALYPRAPAVRSAPELEPALPSST